MRVGQDIAIQFPGLFVVHHNKPKSRVEKHSHKEHHLIIPLRGELKIQFEDKQWSFGPGKMAYIASKQEHEFFSSNEKEGERLIALIDEKLWKKFVGKTFESKLLPAQQLIKELLFQLIVDSSKTATKEMILCFVSVLGSMLNESNEYGTETSTEHLLNKAQDPKAHRAAEYLQKHFSEELKISALARYSGMSERSLNRAFMAEFGVAPKQALLRFRLEKARELLKLGRMSVTDVSYEVGYSSLSRFIQAYRSTFGRLPSEESL